MRWISRQRARPPALQVWRAGALMVAAWLLHSAAPRHLPSGTNLPLEWARHFFPAAARLDPPDGRGVQTVHDALDRHLGSVLTTAPDTDDLVGYSGPNNLLVALDPEGRVAGLELLTSGDTPAHVSAARQDAPFWRTFDQWLPVFTAPPPVTPVSGATLTTLAIAEAVERRLTGQSVSLRFPDPITLAEVRSVFPEAARWAADPDRPGWLRVVDAAGVLQGFVVRTAPASDNVRGYQGPSESLVAIAPDGNQIAAVRLRRTYDHPDYADRIRDDADYLPQLAGWTAEEWARLDLGRSGLEGVSGATQTSYAVAEGLRRRFAAELTQRESEASAGPFLHGPRDWGLAVIVVGGIVLSFSSWRGNRWVRRAWQVVLMVGLGLWLGDLLSLALLVGWAEQGVAAAAAPALPLLAAVAFLLPWATRRQVYCHQLCPHGAAQEWLGLLRPRPVRIPARLHQALSWVPFGTLALALLTVMAGHQPDLTRLEPFDAWTLRSGTLASAAIAIAGLAAACFFPMAYCRYGCPTGALLRFVRSAGAADRFGPRDAAALALLALGGLLALRPTVSPAPSDPAAASLTTRVGGTAFGTSWTVTTRRGCTDPAQWQTKLQQELERIESAFSHWRPESVTSQFNAAPGTDALPQPPEWVQLLARATAISRASDGAFDLTVAPWAAALGFGPHPTPGTVEGSDALATARQAIGWRKMRIDAENGRVAKTESSLQLDLGAILQGYAADRLVMLLREAGYLEALVDVGGELRALGSWEVAIENPLRPGQPLNKLRLTDGALATSGVYRGGKAGADGRRRAHILDPRTGAPVAHDTVLVAVVAADAETADGWATALLVLGGDAALRVADRERLAALVVQQGPDDRLTVRRSRAMERWLPPATSTFARLTLRNR